MASAEDDTEEQKINGVSKFLLLLLLLYKGIY